MAFNSPVSREFYEAALKRASLAISLNRVDSVDSFLSWASVVSEAHALNPQPDSTELIRPVTQSLQQIGMQLSDLTKSEGDDLAQVARAMRALDQVWASFN